MTTTSLASNRELEVDIFDVSTCLPPPPPPSHPIASWRWIFSTFRRVYHRLHLPRIQSRAGGGYFRCFDAFTTATTSLASKRKPEVDFFDVFDAFTAATTSLTFKCELEVDLFDSFDVFTTASTSLASKRELEVDSFDISTRLPPPPPPSCPSASRRWIFHLFRRIYHDHHLPRIQTRAGGGSFICFNGSTTTTTSLASKREPEVVILLVLTVSTDLPPPPPPSRPNASWRWFFRLFRPTYHHHHLPRIQTRAGGGFFDFFDAPATTPPPSHSNASWRWFPRLFRHASHHLLPEVAHSPYLPPPHILISTNASENNPEAATPYVAISSSHLHANASENDPEAVTPYAAISPSHLIANALESDQEAALTRVPPHPPISREYPLGCSTRIFFFSSLYYK